MLVTPRHRRCESAINVRWQDVSAISFSTNTNDESIVEVLEDLKSLSKSRSPSVTNKVQPEVLPETQFEALKGGNGRKGYYRVLHLR